jgi:hypothetical protein
MKINRDEGDIIMLRACLLQLLSAQNFRKRLVPGLRAL